MAKGRHSGRLTVILHADVADSTSLVQKNELQAHEEFQLTFHRFKDTINRYGGRVLELRGDAVIAEFDRASDAVSSALSFQLTKPAHAAAADDGLHLNLRIGIALGEVVIADETVTGAGVVLAQRIENLADPGGVCITSAIHEALPRRMPFEFEHLGDRDLKGFEDSVRVFKVRLRAGEPIPAPQAVSGTGLRIPWPTAVLAIVLLLGLMAGFTYYLKIDRPQSQQVLRESGEKPVVAVLPFENMSGDPRQEYFSDGISEDIITDLTRFDSIRVLAGTTTFKLRGQKIDYQQLIDELKISHVLEGSVRKAGDTLRISARLISARDGQSLWADRYDKPLKDIFKVQDDVSRSIANALSVELTEQDRLAFERPTTSNFEAYDLYLQGRRRLDERTPDSNQSALDLYHAAIDLDPNFARAYGAVAVALIRNASSAYIQNPEQVKNRALFYARKAVELDQRSQNTYWALGFTHLFRKEFAAAEAAISESLRIAPNYADGIALMALLKNYLEQPDEAIALIEKAMILNPGYSWDYPFNLGFSYYLKRDFDKAIGYLTSALERNLNARTSRFFLIACYMETGAIDDAEWEMEQIFTLNPDYTIEFLLEQYPISDTPGMNRFVEQLRQAGLPD